MRLASTIRRLWRVVRATPAQRVAVDVVLGARPVVVAPVNGVKTGGARFSDVERVLSLALDALLDAIEFYRERKRGGSL